MNKNFGIIFVILVVLLSSFTFARQYIYEYDGSQWNPIYNNTLHTGRWYSAIFYYTDDGSISFIIRKPIVISKLPVPLVPVPPVIIPIINKTNNTGNTTIPPNITIINPVNLTFNVTNSTNTTYIPPVIYIPMQLPEYRNAYMIGWYGTACDNIKYAQNMGYDYVMYQSGMENCPGPINLHFYYEGPDAVQPIWSIDYNTVYTQQQIDLYNKWFTWKDTNSTFPYNLATGWWYSKTSFHPVPNLQQQWIITELINHSLDNVKNKERPAKGFLFGGWSWDVPQLDGDFWSAAQTGGNGQQVTVKYWTGSCSGKNLNNDYACYIDGKAEMYKQLFQATRQIYPNMKVYLEPYNIWNDYLRGISNRSDKQELLPDYLCSESARIDFVNDPKVLAIMPANKMCSDTPDTSDHLENVKIAGTLAVKGAWFTWFGRMGGSGTFQLVTSIRLLPDRLKLLRQLPNWDNLNGVPLNHRVYINNTYKSTLSYADNNILYSLNPKNHLLYVVVLNQSAPLPFNNYNSIFMVDNLFGITGKQILTEERNGKLYLANPDDVGLGFVVDQVR